MAVSGLRSVEIATATFVLFVSMGGCTYGPTNGQKFTGQVGSNGVTAIGFYNEPNASVNLQYLSNASNDPKVTANWSAPSTTQTATGATYHNSSSPLYFWQASVTATPAAWPQGGLMRLRAWAVSNQGYGTWALQAYDQDRDKCIYTDYPNASWMDLGDLCGSPYPYNGNTAPFQNLTVNPVAALVSTTPLPRPEFPIIPPYLTKKGPSNDAQGRSRWTGPQQEAMTNAYYARIAPPATLAAFIQQYQFGTGNPSEVSAIYYNQGDLGLGREMHCIETGGGGRACYVTNYGGADVQGNIVFGAEPQGILNNAIAHTNIYATVVMTYTPPITALDSVKFWVYNAQGALFNKAQLDRVAVNTAIPNNCLVCHGTSSFYDVDNPNANLRGVSNARFLPFDVTSFIYSTNNNNYSLANQQESFRKLNKLVLDTVPPDVQGQRPEGIRTFINGLYNNNVGVPGTQANLNYIPAGWNANRAQRNLYKEVVRLYCNTCHMSGSPSALNFQSHADFAVYTPQNVFNACAVDDSHVMPQAEFTAENFWNSPGRAHLVAGLAATTACQRPPDY